ncbi:hypothetical protein PR048_004044 [Dryococelus australis]|uniref:Uncharacterized protein n=1 Tax=Dryococelus australis TaxID=614101 RepID=A0ABQ9I575_9NEOP|nr:hypothetical protein PR048_004044 [Dryococelus australis]
MYHTSCRDLSKCPSNNAASSDALVDSVLPPQSTSATSLHWSSMPTMSSMDHSPGVRRANHFGARDEQPHNTSRETTILVTELNPPFTYCSVRADHVDTRCVVLKFTRWLRAPEFREKISRPVVLHNTLAQIHRWRSECIILKTNAHRKMLPGKKQGETCLSTTTYQTLHEFVPQATSPPPPNTSKSMVLLNPTDQLTSFLPLSSGYTLKTIAVRGTLLLHSAPNNVRTARILNYNPRLLPLVHQTARSVANRPPNRGQCCHSPTKPRAVLPIAHQTAGSVVTRPLNRGQCCHSPTKPRAVLPLAHQTAGSVVTRPLNRGQCCYSPTKPWAVLPLAHQTARSVATRPPNRGQCCHSPTKPRAVLPIAHQTAGSVATRPPNRGQCCHSPTKPRAVLLLAHQTVGSVATRPPNRAQCCHSSTKPRAVLSLAHQTARSVAIRPPNALKGKIIYLLASHQGDQGSIPGWLTPDFHMWESCRTMASVGGFSRGSPVFPAFSFRRLPILTSITLISFQDLVVKCRPNLFIHSFGRREKVNWVLRAVLGVGAKVITNRTIRYWLPASAWLCRSMGREVISQLDHCHRCQNEGAGKWEIPEKSCPTKGIVRHDSPCENPVTRPGIERGCLGGRQATGIHSWLSDIYDEDAEPEGPGDGSEDKGSGAESEEEVPQYMQMQGKVSGDAPQVEGNLKEAREKVQVCTLGRYTGDASIQKPGPRSWKNPELPVGMRERKQLQYGLEQEMGSASLADFMFKME